MARNLSQSSLADHEILIIRHAPANSNAGSPRSCDRTDLSTLKLKDFAQLLSQGQCEGVKLTNGDYIPDNLSEFGEGMLGNFVKRFSKCEGIDLVLCSPLPRSILTAQKISKTGQNGSIPLECIPGLGENTNWIQDIPPVTVQENGKRYAFSLKLKGDPEKNSGVIMREEKIDLTVDGGNEDWERWNNPQQRLDALKAIPSLDKIEEEDRILRQNIRTRIREIAKRKGGGFVKLVIVTHGGKINTFLGKYYMGYERGVDRRWKFFSSTTLRNLNVVRFGFKSTTDDQAELVELPWSQYYDFNLGSYYRCLEDRKYTNEDGSVVNQRQEYEKFLRSSAEEVRAMLANQPVLVEGLLRWTGRRACLKWLKEKEGEESMESKGERSLDAGA